jgi:hypothetical protein
VRRGVVVGTACALVATAASRPAAAQALAARIAAVADGNVHLTYAARAGFCGDGESVVRSGDAVFVLPDMFGRERDRGTVVCYAGPVRVSIRQSGGEVGNVSVHLGGRWATNDGATDLGTVSAPEAARWMLSQARQLSSRAANYAVVAAALADSFPIADDLARLARDVTARLETRGYAVMWMGFVGGDEARRNLRAMVTDASLSTDMRGRAIVGFAQRDIERTDAEFLQSLYGSLPASLRDRVFLALSRTGDARIHRWLAERVNDRGESIELRKQALFWSGQGDMPVDQLVALGPRLEGRELRDHFVFVLSQRRDEAAVDALIAIARSDPDRELRKRALFWLGQSKSQKARDFLVEIIQRS